MTSTPEPSAIDADRAAYNNAHQRYLRGVAHIAAHLRRLADDVERRGQQYGSILFNQELHGYPAAQVVTTATGLHNLHLGDLVRDAATADRLWHPSFGDPGAQPTETP